MVHQDLKGRNFTQLFKKKDLSPYADEVNGGIYAISKNLNAKDSNDSGIWMASFVVTKFCKWIFKNLKQ